MTPTRTRAEALCVEIFGDGLADILKQEIREAITQALDAERQAGEQAAYQKAANKAKACATERLEQMPGAFDDTVRSWLHCKATEAERIAYWCEQQAQASREAEKKSSPEGS